MLGLSVLLCAGTVATTSCSHRTLQQKKTASYKLKAKMGKTPCPCDSH